MKKLLRLMLCWSLMLPAANAAEIRLPPQALGTSLQELAKQSGIQIVFFSKVVEGHRAPALNGTFTPEAAVAALLEGTDLTYYMVNDRTIEIAANPVVAKVWPVTPAPSAPLDQVEITATREKLSVRAEIQSLEEKFYAEYNKLTSDPQYQIHCRMELQKGASVMSRICQPAFAASVSADQAAAIVREKAPAYQKNMTALVEKSPELLRLVRERNALAQRYEALRNQKQVEPASVETRATTDRWATSNGYQRVDHHGKQYFCRPPIAVSSNQNRQTCLSLAQLRTLRYTHWPSAAAGAGFPYPEPTATTPNPNPPYIPVQVDKPGY